MKHICYLTGSFSRTDGLIWERQGCSMIGAGYRVTYVVSDAKPDEVLSGVQICSTGYAPANRIKRMLFTKRFLYRKALEVDADIYQISEPELISLGLKLLKLNKKVIINIRENYPAILLNKEYLPKVLRKPASSLLEMYMIRSLKRFHAVFSITPDIVNIIKFKWCCENTYLLTNYPVVRTDYCLNKEDYMARKNKLGYIGTVYRVSRQEIAFKALENIPEMEYMIAGKFWGSYKQDLMKLDYWKQVEFIDGFTKDQMSKLYEQLTVSNVLRDFSSTGSPNGSLGVIKIFESMEASLPILCTNVSLYKDMIDRYKCGIYVDPNQVGELEKALRYLVDNKDEAYEMGQNGRKAVLEEFNWESQAKIYLDVINKIV